MLLIQKGKPTKRYCDRCHKRVVKNCLTTEACDRCQDSADRQREAALQEWRERRRKA